MKYKETLTLSENEATFINNALGNIPETESDCVMGEDDYISHTVKFDNGFEMDIKLCGVQFEPGAGSGNLPWTEAILYDENNYQVNMTDPSDEYLGEWELEDDDGNSYVVSVIAKTA